MFNLLQKAHRFHHTVSFFSGIIDQCSSLKSPSNSLKLVHAQLVKVGLNFSNIYLGNRCIDLYFKSGSPKDAVKVFDDMASKNIFSWNLYLKVLVKCFDMATARRVFDEMPERDAVSWNTVISGYVSSGFRDSAWEVFVEMRERGVGPTEFTFSLLLCCVKCRDHAKEMHCRIVKNGGCYSNLVVGNSLIDMYGKLGLVEYSLAVFWSMERVDVISWNAMISGCCKSGYERFSLHLFCVMRSSGFEVDEYTVSAVLTACSNLRNLEKGKQMFCFSTKMGFLGNAVVCSAAIDLFSKCNRLGSALRVFKESYVCDSAMYNAMIACYANHNMEENAFDLFVYSLRESIRPTDFTLSSVLHSAAVFVPVEQGSQLHSLVIKTGFEAEAIVASSLVEMYNKYGLVEFALKIFSKMASRDLIAWNTMILGLADNGKLFEAIELFEKLLESGLHPDQITYSAVLSACSYGGLLEEGMAVFSFMLQQQRGVVPINEHYTCVVNMMIQSGLINEAIDFLYSLQWEPDSRIWESLLLARGDYENLELIEAIADGLMELEPHSSLPYLIYLANTYEQRGRWESVVRLRRKMEKVTRKEVADISWIGIKGYSFEANPTFHHSRENVWSILGFLKQDMSTGDDNVFIN
ncbi:pentatricopeptide repeat-containing protein At1g43980, mitochondrial [Salvia hispanica]|uniref:pentatricopeptide repeat-containing protein At1g43980, mitochondrial n=1 Tax=Salvia hispanica TaxID=49212 RepID=UPI002008F57F|nr:pentatricopeptide repeat-containing protein At1g43980, mitochondrial [Salvia hispanica]XP_047977652.1 pentatricopeptide repeat-containing protein At1g43980, mitochondrial [Salvia hispanica]